MFAPINTRRTPFTSNRAYQTLTKDSATRPCTTPRPRQDGLAATDGDPPSPRTDAGAMSDVNLSALLVETLS